MNVLSIFDGCGMARQVLKNLGINVNKYYASEIDKYAVEICKKNHPDVIQLGDVKNINKNIIKEKIDLLVGGFPCQSFSIAGKRLNFDDKRGQLFFEALRLLKELKPKYFLFENVASMKKETQKIISNLIGVEPIKINSALVSAQQRKRLYWTNIPGIEQPENKNIYLKDILEKKVNKKYYISEKNFNYITPKRLKKKYIQINGEKSLCLTAKGMINWTGDYVVDSSERIGNLGSNSQGNRVYSTKGKSVSLSANGGGVGAKTGLYLLISEATKKGFIKIEPGECFDYTQPNSKTRRGRSMEEKSNCLTAGAMNYMQFTKDFQIRKLTPIECERLQTLPDNYTNGVSDCQRYKMIGNGFTVKVIEHILNNIKLLEV